ncbi:M-phase inducer phosphatase-like [Mya arenaria]|uniref:M-phase inducer phosphatase-like n=1 Tax=Mya arenaria TaxID=6604 RepID=UPI0022E2F9D6|nr:M-phase inducer phosphatase-like [Mya arenaria]
MSIRTRLFEDSPVSDVTSGSPWDEIAAMLTPCQTVNESLDSGIGSSAELSIKLPSRRRLRSIRSGDVKRSLFSRKRPADSEVDDSPAVKKVRGEDIQTIEKDIIHAVERLETCDLVADGSRDYTLPTIPGKHSDLKSISTDIMAKVLAGRYNDRLSKVTVVDCRYPYEYEGGHIQDAVNLYTKDAVNEVLKTQVTPEKRHVLIFHCEFSSERGPKMYRFLRSQDRALNQHNYPALNFPEVYLLHGGYKAFYETQQKLCTPVGYMPMLHDDHAADLRHFRVKSKSWTAGDKQVTSRRHRSRIARLHIDL